MAKKSKSQKSQKVSAAQAQPVSAQLKAEVEQKSQALVDHFKTQHIQPPPEGHDFNYIEDITTKWGQNRYFFFCSQYRCPSPRALAPNFEAPFARLEHIGAGRFQLAFMRHTGQWVQVFTELSLDECLDSIRTNEFFQP